FEVFGAPFIDPLEIIRRIEPGVCDGAILRPLEFRPTFNKWSGQVCKGFQIHVTDPARFRPYRASLGIIAGVIAAYGDAFAWVDPPYEYVYDQLPIDVILGDSAVRIALEEGRSVLDLERDWDRDLAEFNTLRTRFRIY
ncbi:MAG: DUF1343 domain-containing protein, partial [Pseudomonadota bacterium]